LSWQAVRLHGRRHFLATSLPMAAASSASGPQKRSLFEASFETSGGLTDSGKKSRGRTSKTQSLEASVSKALSDNFSGWAARETDAVCIAGMTLRQRLTEDKRMFLAKDAKAPTMGRKYYEQLRQDFSSADSPKKKLVPTNPMEVIDDALLRAMCASKQAHPNRMPMIQLLANFQACNQSSVVGIFRWQLDLVPAASQEQMRGCIETMKWVVRTGIHTKFPTECAIMTEKWNDILLQVQHRNQSP
jgi:hypothetical protein